MPEPRSPLIEEQPEGGEMRDATPAKGGNALRLAALVRSALRTFEQSTAPAVEALGTATTRAQQTAAAEGLLQAVGRALAELLGDLAAAAVHVARTTGRR